MQARPGRGWRCTPLPSDSLATSALCASHDSQSRVYAYMQLGRAMHSPIPPRSSQRRGFAACGISPALRQVTEPKLCGTEYSGLVGWPLVATNRLMGRLIVRTSNKFSGYLRAPSEKGTLLDAVGDHLLSDVLPSHYISVQVLGFIAGLVRICKQDHSPLRVTCVPQSCMRVRGAPGHGLSNMSNAPCCHAV